MECKKCKKSCMDSELINGFCEECRIKYKDNTEQLYNCKNSIANSFKIWASCSIAAGIILAIICFIFSAGVAISVIWIIAALVISALLRAVAEIIQLLEDIKNKL